MPYVKKMIFSGKLLEIEKYPVSRKGCRVPRCGKYKVSSESQQNLNEKNSKKQFLRLVECNFTERDLYITLSYKNENLPKTSQKLKKDFQNFIRRLKYRCSKENLPAPVYMAVSHDKHHRAHHHLLLKKCSWDMIEKLWQYGGVNIQTLIPDDEYGFVQVGKYIINQKNENSFDKRWCASQNLKKPIIKYKDIKRMTISSAYDAPKGYRITDISITDNEFVGMYQYIRCVKLE